MNKTAQAMPKALLNRILEYTPENQISMDTIEEMLEYIYGDLSILKAEENELEWARAIGAKNHKAYKISCYLTIHCMLKSIERSFIYRKALNGLQPFYIKYIPKAKAIAFSTHEQTEIKLLPIGDRLTVAKPAAYYPNKFKRIKIQHAIGKYSEKIPALVVNRKFNGRLISFSNFNSFWGDV